MARKTHLIVFILSLFSFSTEAKEGSLLLLKKHFLQGLALSEKGQSVQAIEQFSALRDGETGIQDYILFYLGRELRRVERCEESKAVFQELVDRYPESRWLPLAKVQSISEVPCPPLVLPVPEDKKMDCADLPREREQAECYFHSRRYVKAKGFYQKFVEMDRPRSTRRMNNLVSLSQTAARSQDFEVAIQANEILKKEFPKKEPGRSASRKIAFLHQDAGEYEKTIPVFQELIQESRSSQERRYYGERLGWSYFRLAHYQEAITTFDTALEEGETPFSLYWKGRSLEKLGRRKEADQIFHSLTDIYRESYYGLRALEREPQKKKKKILHDWWEGNTTFLHWSLAPEMHEMSRPLSRVYDLASLGLLKEASLEGRRARVQLKIALPSDPKRLRKRGHQFSFESRFLRQNHDNYLLPHADFVFMWARDGKPLLDPFLVYAMMRQESRYREKIVSPAGAIGLLQIMPLTGKRLASETGWDDFHVTGLYDAVTNIDLGIQYLKKLSVLFQGCWYAMAASYNAGEQPVAAWIKQRQGLTEEEFIEEIPYTETRDYVKKVYTHWQAYRTIYRER